MTANPIEKSKNSGILQSLLGLLISQFLGAFNDNVYKMVLSLLAANQALATGDGGYYIALIGAIFILPFVLFSGYAGYAADVLSKRTVLITAKCLEVASMGLGFFAFLAGELHLMLGVLFLMALQSTFFSPAKYGILPELLPDRDLSRANGLMEMSTFLAIILGTSLGSFLFAHWNSQLDRIGLVLLALSIVGSLASLAVPHVPASGSHTPFLLNPWAEIVLGLKRLIQEKAFWLIALGTAYFWYLGALLQMDLILLGKEIMHLNDIQVGLLATFLAIGIGTGSLSAGRLSDEKVELGLVPLGSIGIGVFSLLLYGATHSYTQTALMLVGLGFAGGLFIVPLQAFLQQKSGTREKGRVLATTNFLSTVGILIASGVLWLLRDYLGIPADTIIALSGLLTLGVTAYLLYSLPDFLIRCCLWLLSHAVYRVNLIGKEHIPQAGPALIVCNHVALVDGLLVGSCMQRLVRFLIFQPIQENAWLHGFLSKMKAIPISAESPEEISASLQCAREQLQQGHVVCIFAEAERTCRYKRFPFKRTLERIVKGLDAPLIPVHIHSSWSSLFSRKDRRSFWPWPRRLSYPVTISFGAPLSASTPAEQVRQAVTDLGGGVQ